MKVLFCEENDMSEMSEYTVGHACGVFTAISQIGASCYGKDSYFSEPGGSVYSRISGEYLTIGDALAELCDYVKGVVK